MFRNYCKMAFRNLAKHKFISFINLFGLTVGLACCLLILTFIIQELQFDRSATKADRIYRVTRTFNNKDGIVSLHLASVAPPIGPLLQNDFPDIQRMTRVLPNGPGTMKYEEKIFNEKNIFIVDTNFLGMFDVPLLKGDPSTALTNPFSVVLTQEAARRYFGNEDPMNKVIRMDRFNCKVTGIFQPMPVTTHFHPEILLSFSTLKDSAIYGEKNLQTNWGNNAFFTYLLLPKDYPVASLEKQFPAFLDKQLASRSTLMAGNSSKPSKFTSLSLQKLTDIHLRSHLDSEIEGNGDIKQVYIFGAIALFILLIACINYMNLSTARSALRAKEIGIRKTSGAMRSEIITQFLSESILITWIAIVLAIVCSWQAMPWVNSITGFNLSLRLLMSPYIITLILLSPFIVGILSGIYPALFMSSFQPVKVLKGLFKAGNGSVSLRRVLVVLQFSISIILIICTAVVFQQLHYVQAKSLGLDKEHVIDISYPGDLSNSFEAFRTQLLQNPAIIDISGSSRIPSGRLLDEQDAFSEAGDSLKPVTADIKYVATDYHFLPTYDIKLLAGRNFSQGYSLDTTSFILNNAAIKVLGMHNPREAIGKAFKYAGVKGHIIGVMDDFHFESLHQPIVPVVFYMPSPTGAKNYFAHLSVKLSGAHTTEALSYLEKTWKQYLPQTPFEYNFLNDLYAKLYEREQRQGTLFTCFAGIAIFIACLGLLGLSAFTISQRIKEIGIRKVLGASVGSIVGLLSGDFMILVLVSAVIAFPIAWFAMHSWLQDFVYRVTIAWWIFLAAAMLAAVVALITLGFQAIRAATANPVKSLKNE